MELLLTDSKTSQVNYYILSLPLPPLNYPSTAVSFESIVILHLVPLSTMSETIIINSENY